MEENKNKSKGVSIVMILLAVVLGFGFVIGLTQTKGAQNLGATATEISNYVFDENGNLLSYNGDMTELEIPETYSLTVTSEEKTITSANLNSVVNQAINLGLNSFHVDNQSGYFTDEFGNTYYEEKYSITYNVRKTIEGTDYTVKNIESGAFRNNSKLISVKIPNSVIRISSQVFQNCYNLKSITLPESLETIDYGAFNNCRKLESIEIPDSVSFIGSDAFFNCDKLTSVKLPNSIMEVHSNLFGDCDGLREIEIPGSVRYIYAHAFNYCRNLTSIKLNEGLRTIDSYAFNGCTGLNIVDIPSTVTNLGSRAFYTCNNLNTVIIRGDRVLNIQSNTFPTNVERIYVSDAFISEYPNYGYWYMYEHLLCPISQLDLEV